MGEKIPQVSSLVKVKNLSLNIGDTAILKKISFTIGTQEIVSIVGESVSNPFKYYHNNVCGTLNLLKSMVDSIFGSKPI